MIAQKITGRNENGVKNRFNSLIKREVRSKRLHSAESLPKSSKETLLIESLLADLRKSMNEEPEQKLEASGSDGDDEESDKSGEVSASQEKTAFFQQKHQVINSSFDQNKQNIQNTFTLPLKWECKIPVSPKSTMGFPSKNPNFHPREIFTLTRETQNLTYMKESLNLHQFFTPELHFSDKGPKPSPFPAEAENSSVVSESECESSHISHEAEIINCLKSSSPSNSEETLSMDPSETHNDPPLNLLLPGEKRPCPYNVCKFDPKSFAQERRGGRKLQVALIDHEQKRIFLCGKEIEETGGKAGSEKRRIEKLMLRLNGKKITKKRHHS